ncbi:MAG: hypothetical protein ACR2N6_08615 [Miltoncostaeaceae bacterium]
MRRRRWLTLVVVVILATLAAACGAEVQVDVDVDREGRGEVRLRASLDPQAQEALGLSGASDEEVRARFEPLLVDGGWVGDGEERIALIRDTDGDLVLETSHEFDDLDQLRRVLGEQRPIATLAPDAATLEAIPDLPQEAPLINEFALRLGEGTGDNPGFNLFGRGGVGQISGATCSGDSVVGFASTLRNSTVITYRVALPGGPGETNADDTPSGTNVWNVRFGDCPALTAEAGGGGSSTLVNGIILGLLVAFLAMVFAIRTIRRRRRTRGVPQGS